MSLNNQEIFDSSTLYAYRAFISTELSCSPNVKKTELACAGYALTEKYNTQSDPGFVARNAMLTNGAVQFFSRLDIDIGNQPNLLVNDVDVVFTLYKAEDNFVLENLGSLVCRVVPKSIKLYIQTIDVQPSLNVKFFEMLDKQPANYAYRKTEARSYFLTPSRQEAEINLCMTEKKSLLKFLAHSDTLDVQNLYVLGCKLIKERDSVAAELSKPCYTFYFKDTILKFKGFTDPSWYACVFGGYLSISVQAYYKIMYDIDLELSCLPVFIAENDNIYYPIELIDVLDSGEICESVAVKNSFVQWKTNVWNGRLRYR
uniref:PAZ domain-containing protein n=1 Tax=Panagrolaimus sp. PS1159 TaxID=55785 RepID=A0AC35EUD4_9BILA